MRKISLVFSAFLFLALTSEGQKTWSLRECVEYAVEHNLSVKKSDIQVAISEINYRQSKLSQIPSLGFSNSEGLSFGKSQNPSTGILENQNYFSVGVNLQSSAQIFNFFSKKNSILANEWSLMSMKATAEKLRDDIALSVANAYLQVLLAIEQEKIAEVQVKQSLAQLDVVEKQVAAGVLPELNLAELQAQLANDSATLISAGGNIADAKFILKGWMNIGADEAFEIEEPPVEQIPVEPIGNLQPADVYAYALQNRPEQKINEYNLKSAKYTAKAAKGALYPSVSAFGSLSSNYGYFKSPVYEQIFSGYRESGLVVPDGSGGYVSVQQPVFKTGTERTGYMYAPSFGDQFNNNFGQQLGLSVQVPIFNGWSARASYKRAKLNIQTVEYENEEARKQLKQNIYQAYNQATVALEKFTSSTTAVTTAQKSYDYAKARHDVGMLTTFELITNQNNLFRAKLQYVVNQFDYVFKMKVLEFYKGMGVKL